MAHLTKFKHQQIRSAEFFDQFTHIKEPPAPRDPVDVFMANTQKKETIRNIIDTHMDIWEQYQILLRNYRPLRMRGDITTLCSWRFNLPENVTDPNMMSCYFIQAFQFVNDLYNVDNENLLGCWIHGGEKPYMIFLFCPIVVEPETGKKRINCSALIDRRHLFNFHPDFYNFLESKGFNVKEGIFENVTKQD